MEVYDEEQLGGDTKIIAPIKVEFAEVEQATNLITTIMKGTM